MDKYDIIDKETTTNTAAKQYNLLQRILLWCSGVDLQIILKCKQEWNKYICLGIAILLSTLLSASIFSYAFYILYRTQYASIDLDVMFSAILLGLLVGCVMLSLYRYFFSLLKQASHRFLKSELAQKVLCLLPSLTILILVTLFAAKPIKSELYRTSFAHKIAQGTSSTKSNAVIKAKRQERDKLQIKLPGLQKDSTTCWNTYKIDKVNAESAQDALNSFLDPIFRYEPQTNAFTGVPEIRKEIQYLKDEYHAEYNRLLNNRTKARMLRLESEVKYKDVLNTINEIRLKMSLCNKEAELAEAKAKNGSYAVQMKNLNMTYITLLLLFILFTYLPIIMLLCLSKDAYDLLVEAEYYQTQKLSQLLQKKADKLYTWEVKAIENEQKTRHQMTLEVNQQVLEKIASIQTELINTSLEEWRKAELEHVKKNPTTYIKTKISES